ncbi:MAG: cation transporter [Butyrivibrio sp.]
MTKTYDIEVDCANCAAKMEDAVKNTPGIKDATISFMTLKLKVEFEDGADERSVMRAVIKNCKKVEDDCEIFL